MPAKTDTQRLDKLQAYAERKGCGWWLDLGRPTLKHWSQVPPFGTIRQAIDAMEDGDRRKAERRRK